MKVVNGYWKMEGTPEVRLNLNTGLGPAPGGYLHLNEVEVYITPTELRLLWDAWAEFHLPGAP